ncbi:MAG: aldo/keto reductase [Candidatus Eremiobacteraeota bacterium]|nr:aldo/keto reductase [Candidatus Eremiobacteraeota bacterium]
MKIDRPSFLAGALALAGQSAFARRAAAATAAIPKRRLGRTNQMVSLVALGGFHIGQSDLPGSDATKLIHTAIDRGITFMDNSWDYNGGNSELRMGKALDVAGYRDRVFLMTKIDGRTKSAAQQQIDQSLARLLTDRIDLLQFHENIRPDDADRIFAEGGAFEAAMEAKKAGKIRFIGFTGHKLPAYHLHMIDVAAKHGFTFDTVQMPLNVMDAHYSSFEKNVLPVANELDMGVLAMKTFGDHHILDTGAVDPIDMLHYGMNLPVSTVVTGIDKMSVLDQAVMAATTFAPLSKMEVAAILQKTAKLAADGSTELYKTTHVFDGTVQNPQWLDMAQV